MADQSFTTGTNFLVRILSSKYNVAVISILGYQDCFYSELLTRLNYRSLNCSKRMLSFALKQLNDQGIIKRTVYPTVPPRVKYSLTQDGEELCRLIRQLNHVGDQLATKNHQTVVYPATDVDQYFNE